MSLWTGLAICTWFTPLNRSLSVYDSPNLLVELCELAAL